MKVKQIGSTLLACVLLAGLFVPAASAAGAEAWEKTEPYNSFIGRFFAMPKQYILKELILPKLLGDLGGSLQGITEGLYTSETVNMVMLAQRAIEFTISQGSANSRQFLRPYKVSAAIKAFPDTKEKYEEVAKALDTAMVGSTTGGNAADTAAEWAAVDALIESGALDWGVKDRESFLEASGIALRPLLNLLCHRTLNFRGEDGVYAKQIIPGLKALGCKNILSLEAFEAEYLAALKVVGSATTGMMADLNAINAKMRSDFALTAILNPILDLLEELQANLQGKLVSILPNLAYHKDDVTAFLNAAIDNNGEETKIFEALGGAFGIDLSGSLEDVLEKAISGLPVKLPPIPWRALAGAGTLDTQTDTVIADENIVYAVAANYVSDAIGNDPKGVRDLLAESLGIPVWLGYLVYYLLRLMFSL